MKGAKTRCRAIGKFLVKISAIFQELPLRDAVDEPVQTHVTSFGRPARLARPAKS